MKRTPYYLHVFISFAIFALLGLGTAAADTISVPLDFPTIQEAIDSAVDGDTVLVAPGTYVENINFWGKAITVTSEEGPEVTIVDGNQAGPVVTFTSGEGLTSVVTGFTLQNGRSSLGAPCKKNKWENINSGTASQIKKKGKFL